jgi:predicted nucleic acid-binding protein
MASGREGKKARIIRRFVVDTTDLLANLVDEVLAVDQAAVERAKDIVMGHRRLSARNALHIAVMERHEVGRILSFDAGFDGIPGIMRLR